MRFVWLAGVVFLTLTGSTVSWADTYNIDKDHSSVTFKVRHLLSNTAGSFKEFEGTFVFDAEKPETWSASGIIQAASIDTNVSERDKHLRSKDFFEVEKYPVIIFKTVRVIDASKESAKVEGLLTMHGVEKPVVLDVQIHGTGMDPWGKVRSAFTATTKINRKDFGIEYNKVLEQGQLMLGEEVSVTLEVEGIKV
jgi:polyisoprenoid-binding protein YceI